MSYRALLFCPDDKTARAVTHVLSELEFAVDLCVEPFAAVKKLMAEQFDAVVVDCDSEQNAALLFKSARNSGSNQNSLAVAVVEGQAGVAKAFRIGANLVLTKPINVEQAKGTLRVARGLLRKAEAAKPSLPQNPTPEHPISRDASPTFKVPTTPAHMGTSVGNEAPSSSSNPSNISFQPKIEPERPSATMQSATLNIPASGVPKSRSSSEARERISKESPWQQLSKPSALSQEPVSQDSSQTAQSIRGSATGEAPATRHPFNTGLSSSHGSAAAAAPAREKQSAASHRNVEPTLTSSGISNRTAALEEEESSFQASELSLQDVPTFASSSEGTTRSKTPLMVMALVVALSIGSYFAWTKMHATQPVTVQAPSQTQPALIPTPTPSETTGLTQSPQPAGAIQSTQNSQPETIDISLGSQPAKASAKTESATSEEHTDVTVRKIADTVVVKSAPAEEVVVPPALQIASSASDNAITGIVTSMPIAMPKKSQQVLRVSQGVTEGLLLKKVNPTYPAQAVSMRKQGTVQIVADIGKSGSITNAKISGGDPILGQAALTAVKQWKYKPYYLNGEPIEIQTQITVNFKLP